MIELPDFQGTPIHPLRRTEYDLLVKRGVLKEDDNVELLDGVLVAMSPKSSEHAEYTSRLTEAFWPAVRGRARVRVQTPLAISDMSEPEPDFALVPDGDYLREHPTTAFLVVEVAGDSLRKDRVAKNRLYAASGIPEYWIINVHRGELEVYREPSPAGYGSMARYTPGQRVACLHFPEIDIDVAQLLGDRENG